MADSDFKKMYGDTDVSRKKAEEATRSDANQPVLGQDKGMYSQSQSPLKEESYKMYRPN